MDPSRRKLLITGSRLAAGFAALKTNSLHALQPPQQSSPVQAHSMPAMSHTAPISAAPVHRPLLVDRLEPFVDPLPVPPIVQPSGRRPNPFPHTGSPAGEPIDFYHITMRRIETRIHRDVPATPMWSYGQTVPGPTIEARSGHPLLIEWTNELPAKHFLPIDNTLCGAEAGQPEVRTAIHVHGAKVPPQFDGNPEDWKVPGQSYQAVYPLHQDAATLWYHDHAMGIERLNQYAGLFGFFLIRDESERQLNLPSGKYEIPLAFADRLFSADGSLYYPDSGDPAAPWIPELYGDAMLVNGKLTPFLGVEPRPYRFRMLNAANSRTFVFSLSNKQSFHQIGTDQGLLETPAELPQVSLSPGERADILIDFSKAAGQRLTFNNQSWELMQFRVSNASVPNSHSLVPIPSRLRTIPRIPESAAIQSRMMILREYMARNPKRMLMLINGTRYHEPVTERPELDSVEIWSFANTTADIHPIHLHLVRFQVLDRQSFDADEYLLSGKMNFRGAPAPPPPGDRGWKDTVQTYPETVTRVMIRFEGYTGRYVWHCHLLEHAANEMMRPFEVIAKPNS